MSKMGQEFEKRLDENKADLYWILKNLVERLDKGLALGEALDLQPARKVLKKIED